MLFLLFLSSTWFYMFHRIRYGLTSIYAFIPCLYLCHILSSIRFSFIILISSISLPSNTDAMRRSKRQEPISVIFHLRQHSVILHCSTIWLHKPFRPFDIECAFSFIHFIPFLRIFNFYLSFSILGILWGRDLMYSLLNWWTSITNKYIYVMGRRV